ncbi:ring canal kelch -like [Asbolus verrucosus]|uniref:Ring canal kelch-like n=1 Tax=Asbolus verrucosus TaxID=1661398 RepID=A0A482VSI2_ASBVE|nr:ring canal kelch -like [Asbolus verrucosus]
MDLASDQENVMERQGSCLLLRCDSQNSLDESSQKQLPRSGGKDKPPYRNYHHTQRAFDAMNLLRKQRLLCDVILVADTVEIPAHKMVLAACSPYFYAMFTSFEESKQDRIVLQEVDHQALQILVEYVYTSEVQVTEDNVQVLLPAANLLQLTDVRDACCEFLQVQLHPTNCLGIRAFADLHGCLELLTHAESYIEQHFTEVVECEEFLTLSHQQVSKLICSDRLTVPSEEKVFECVIAWVQHDLDIRRKHLATLMEHVRLPLMSQEYLMHRVEEEPLLKVDLQCKDYLIEALKYHLLKGDNKTTFRTPRTKPRQPVGLPKVLLVVGGQAPKAIRSVECFDFKEEKWYQVAEMPTRRCRAGLAVLHGKVYAVGGFNGSLRVRTVDVYDAASDQWTTCDHMEARRSTLGVAVLGNCIYAVGGFDGSTGLNTAEMFDLSTQKWRSIAPMSTRRSSVGVGVLYGLLYAVGGYDGASRQCLSSVECYTPEIDCWTSVPDMGCRRSGAGVGVLDGILYAVGGHDGPQVRKSVEAYDPAKRMWTSVSDMTFCRRNAGVVALNGMLYVVGGDDGCSNLSSVEVYNPKTDMWTMLPSCMSIGRSYAGGQQRRSDIYTQNPVFRYANCDENSNAEGAVGYDHQPNIYESIDPTASNQEAENIYETIEDVRQEGAPPPPPPAPPVDEQSPYDVNPDVPGCSTYGRIGNAYGRIDIIGHGIGRIERHLSSSCGSINSNHYALESVYGTSAGDSTGRISKVSVQWLLANKWLPLWIANTETGRDYRIIDFLLAQRADSEESLGDDHEGPAGEQGPQQS